jgi:hypothetical protein
MASGRGSRFGWSQLQQSSRRTRETPDRDGSRPAFQATSTQQTTRNGTAITETGRPCASIVTQTDALLVGAAPFVIVGTEEIF